MAEDSYYYVRVTDEEAADDVMELPTEPDGTILLSTIQAQFPGVSGLRYRNEVTMSWRGVRISEGILYPPPEGWGSTLYFITYPRDTSSKRKIDESPGQREPEAKLVKTRNQEHISDDEHIGDLIVLGLPFRATEQDMRSYFEQFGEITFVQVKEFSNGTSRGFGFVSFKENSVAMSVLKRTHTILGRRCEVRLPRPKEDPNIPYKIFVGRLASGTTRDDLKSYFEMFGDLTDTYIPQPFRGFGFVTFASSESVKRVMKNNHSINGAHVNVTFAAPKGSTQDMSFHGMSNMMNFFGMKGGMNPFAFYSPRGGGGGGGGKFGRSGPSPHTWSSGANSSSGSGYYDQN